MDWWINNAHLVTIPTTDIDGKPTGSLILSTESAKALEKVFVLLDEDNNGYFEVKDLELKFGRINSATIAKKWAGVCEVFPKATRITPERFVKGMAQYTLDRVPIGQVRDAPTPPPSCPRGGQGIALLSANIASRGHRTTSS